MRVAAGVVANTFGVLRQCGIRALECVVYWTGPSQEELVDEVVHPLHHSTAYGYAVDENWLTNFWGRLLLSGRSVKAQVHSHPGTAFHSATDDRWPIVSQSGFVSIVVPNFAAGEPSLRDAWVGRLGEDGRWRQLSSVEEALDLP